MADVDRHPGELRRGGQGDFTHLDEQGKARMVDVGDKAVTEREAVARGSVSMRQETLERVRQNEVAKGDVLGVARVAGIMAAKRTSEFIPLCHQLSLSSVQVVFRLRDAGSEGSGTVDVQATVRTTDRTGVEMEALTAVSTAALTIYDMCKALDRGMQIGSIRLVRKTGGRSGTWERQDDPDW